jgi:hypothetical protein
MLSKLFYQTNVIKPDLNAIQTALEFFLKKEYSSVSLRPHVPKAEGTLGVFFLADIEKNTCFVKTHLPGEYYYFNHLKEAKILQTLYGSELFIRSVNLDISGMDYSFLIMDCLEPLERKPDIALMRELIEAYERKLQLNCSLDCFPYALYSFAELLQNGLNALKWMECRNLLSRQLVMRCQSTMESLAGEKEFQLCHGDLSNKNIMRAKGRLYIIDWEDAFWGVHDYDICYWMTFFDQRKYYHEGVFPLLGVDYARGVALMLLAVTLKCQLSFQNDSYRNHSLTAAQRLEEILAL